MAKKLTDDPDENGELNEEADDDEERGRKPRGRGGRRPAARKELREPDQGELDSVRMYLSKIGCVDLLTREQEVEIAKRIEAAREGMLAGILATQAGVNAFVDLPRRQI